MPHTSYWRDLVARPAFQPLVSDTIVDVCVIGGGITGATTALLCARAGLRVILVEARTLGSGVTGCTSAHLTWQTDLHYTELKSKWGVEKARLAIEAHRGAVDWIARQAAEGIDCDFSRVPGYLYAAHERHVGWLQEQAEAAEALQVACTYVGEVPLPFKTFGGLRFDHQARLHPLKYLRGLAAQLARLGTIVESTRVLEVTDGEPCVVTTDRGKITAREVVIATHSPIDLVLSVQTRVEAFRSYVVAFETQEPIPDALFWDSEEPYNYLRADGHVVIVGGRDHKTGKGEDLSGRFTDLLTYAKERFVVGEVVARWSAQVFEPADGLPYVGHAPGWPHVQVASGFSGNGLTGGTAAALTMSDAILGNANPYLELWSPKRGKVLGGLRRMVHEGVDSVLGLVGKRFAPDEVASLDEVPSGQGRVLTAGGHKVAAYRDEQGVMHVRSATCTHAGCIVSWNDAEQTWDCPCHGGRFTCMGEVLEGPPVRGLPSIKSDT